jgi:hypothetical protein
MLSGGTAWASTSHGYGTGNFDEGGSYANQVDVLGHPTGIRGYIPAPGIMGCSGNPSGTVSIDLAFTVQRFTGKNHVPYTQAITIPMTARLVSVGIKPGNIDGISDPGFSAGDPSTPTDQTPATPPPFSEAFLLAHYYDLTETVQSTTNYAITLPALPPGTTDAQAAAQTQSFDIQLNYAGCGYFELDSVLNPFSGNGHEVLGGGFFRTFSGTGYGVGNLDQFGQFANQVGESLPQDLPNGYSPAPAVYDCSEVQVIPYDFTVHRYTGKNHVPYTQAISIPMSLVAKHVDTNSDGLDNPADFAAGDPQTLATAPPATPPPYSQAYMLKNFSKLTWSVVSSRNFTITLPGMPPGTTNAQAMAQTESFQLTVTINGGSCGYYNISTVVVDNTAGAHKTASAGYVRVMNTSQD